MTILFRRRFDRLEAILSVQGRPARLAATTEAARRIIEADGRPDDLGRFADDLGKQFGHDVADCAMIRAVFSRHKKRRVACQE